MIPCNESFFAKVCVLEVKKRKGFHAFSTSALNYQMSSGAAEFGCRTFKKGIFIFDIIIIWLSLCFNNKLLTHD